MRLVHTRLEPATLPAGALEAAEQDPDAERVDEVQPLEVDDDVAALAEHATSVSRSCGAVAMSSSPRTTTRADVAVLARC